MRGLYIQLERGVTEREVCEGAVYTARERGHRERCVRGLYIQLERGVTEREVCEGAVYTARERGHRERGV